MISEELDDCPLYYVIDKLANVIHCSVPSMLQFRSALISLGFNVSSTHANSNGLKTNAPNKGKYGLFLNHKIALNNGIALLQIHHTGFPKSRDAS